MKKLLIIASILLLVAQTADPTPPIIPNHLTQKFVEGYYSVKYYTTGQLWYDWNQQAERIDRVDGRFQLLCGSVKPNVATPCTQLLVGGQFYLIYPDKKQCCRCCSASSGCVIDPPNKLSGFKYEGIKVLQGQQFNKWTYEHLIDFYDTTDQKRIPRRTDQVGQKVMDFIMSSFNTDKISPDVFALPSYCIADCPRNTICGQIEPGNETTTPNLKTNGKLITSFKNLIDQARIFLA